MQNPPDPLDAASHRIVCREGPVKPLGHHSSVVLLGDVDVLLQLVADSPGLDDHAGRRGACLPGALTIQANRFVIGSGWGTATIVEGSIGGLHPDVAVDDSGNAIALWVTTGSNGDFGHLACTPSDSSESGDLAMLCKELRLGSCLARGREWKYAKPRGLENMVAHRSVAWVVLVLQSNLVMCALLLNAIACSDAHGSGTDAADTENTGGRGAGAGINSATGTAGNAGVDATGSIAGSGGTAIGGAGGNVSADAGIGGGSNAAGSGDSRAGTGGGASSDTGQCGACMLSSGTAFVCTDSSWPVWECYPPQRTVLDHCYDLGFRVPAYCCRPGFVPTCPRE